MFTKVHHVTYVIESVQQMADYLESNFGLKPAKTGENPDRNSFCTISAPPLWTSSSLLLRILG